MIGEGRCLNIASGGADVTCDGRLFQKLAPETGKSRLPTVERLNGGTASWLEEADSVGLLQVLTNFDSLSEGGRRRSNSATAVTLVNTQVLENDDKKLSCWYTVSLKLRWFCS